MPKITARVTIAPMTPATGFVIPSDVDAPEDEPLSGELVVEEAELAQMPVLFPQALHHCCWDPMANLFVPSTKVFQGREVCC